MRISMKNETNWWKKIAVDGSATTAGLGVTYIGNGSFLWTKSLYMSTTINIKVTLDLLRYIASKEGSN